MKKTTLFVTMILMTTNVVFGQNFSIGGEFGVTSSINNYYKVTDFENRRNTYYGGLSFNYQYNDRLSFSTGLHYLRQGYRHSTCYIFQEGVKNQLVGKIDYLTIPVSVNIHFLKSRKLITTFGLLGGYNVKAVQDYPEPIGGCEIYYTPDLTSSTQEFSLSGIVGIGYKAFENDKIELIPIIKYYHGLTNTFRNPIGEMPLIIKRKYSSVLITISINYKL
jgi:hypothetical protein